MIVYAFFITILFWIDEVDDDIEPRKPLKSRCSCVRDANR